MALGGPGGSHPAKTTTGDKFYTKCICLVCGIGEVAGEAICGNYKQCFCFNCEGLCGLGGPGGCPAGGSTFQFFSPTADCGAACKLLCCKVGVVAPWADGGTYVVANQKTYV